MTRVETKLKWTDKKFKRRIGTTKPVFLLMLDILQAAYSGYQGIQAYHEWSLIPIKKSKKQELSDSEKAFNRELSRRRIVTENINAQIKVFKIMSYP